MFGAAILMLTVDCVSPAPAAPAAVVVDDFSSGKLDQWQSSTSPEYYKGGQGRQGLSIEADGETSALRAVFGFGDATASEPIWITRKMTPPLPRLPVRTVRFRYRWEVTEPAGAARAPVARGGFKVRLRTSPTSFTDFDVPPLDGGYPVNRWIEAKLNTYALNSKVRNIYGMILGNNGDLGMVQALTFRLDDVDDLNARGALWIKDITFDMEEEALDEPYSPQPSPRQPDERLDVLNLCHNGDGFYDFDKAAKLADPAARVVSSPFRGLHFPLWQFPTSREELLRFDVIVLGDVDPWVLTSDQVHWLADAVHSGVGLLACTGPQSFGNARKHPPALLDLLPVTYKRGAGQAAANAAPAAGQPHVLTANLEPAWLGRVRNVHRIHPRPDARVLLKAGAHPLLISGVAGKGRVLILNSWAQPGRPDDASFMTTEVWQPFAARLLAWLAGRQLPAPPAAPAPVPGTRLAARWLYAKSAFAPGSPFGIVVRVYRPDDAPETLVSAVMKADAEEVWSGNAEASAQAAEVRLEGALPNVASGPVELTVSMPGAAAVTLRGRVVDPLRRDDFFPLITYLPTQDGGHSFDLERVDGLVREVHDHGFNTVAVGGLGSCAGGGIAAALRGRAEATAAALGMASILEYTNFTAYRRNRTYAVSPFAEAFEEHLRQRLAKGLEQARYVPRLLSAKYVDEPFMTPTNLDDSEETRRAFEQVTGRPYVDRESVGEDAAAKYAYGRFLSAYLERDFATGQKIKTDAGAQWDLLQTYCSPGYGSARALDSFEDVYRWSRPADRFDFDVYPYFYPASDRLRFVQANWCFAVSRVVSRALDKPWGFYVEIDDRNYPYQINPAEASAECAYTAVAAGADYLNTFILRTFGSGNASRPERWAKCGEAMRALRRIGPLLTRWRRQPARVGILLPEAHQLIHNGHSVPMYTLSILAQAAGDADVIHEELLAEGPPDSLQVLFVVGADVLRRDAQKRLVEWVRKGGAAVFDRLPTTDEAGKPLAWPAAFRENETTSPFGDGRVGSVDRDLEAQCKEAVEGDDPTAWPKLVEEARTDLAEPLRPAGGVVTVRLTENALHTDASVRLDKRSAGVFVVNHHPEPQPTTVELSNWPFAPAWVVDLRTGETIDTALRNDVLTLSKTIPGRDAWLVGVYEARPTQLQIEVATPTVRRGQPLKYTVRLLNAGQPVRGSFLLDLRVTDPNGKRHERLGGARATNGGVCEVECAVPINAAPGAWTIRAQAPQAGVKGETALAVAGD